MRPLKDLLKKLAFITDNLKVVETSLYGFRISENENIPLGDGFLIATALQHSKPIIIKNDAHIIKTAEKYGLIAENPIPNDIKEKLSQWKNESETYIEKKLVQLGYLRANKVCSFFILFNFLFLQT